MTKSINFSGYFVYVDKIKAFKIEIYGKNKNKIYLSGINNWIEINEDFDSIKNIITDEIGGLDFIKIASKDCVYIVSKASVAYFYEQNNSLFINSEIFPNNVLEVFEFSDSLNDTKLILDLEKYKVSKLKDIISWLKK